MIASPVFGYLGDRFPRTVPMVFGVVAFSIATLVSGFSNSFWELLLARGAVGIGEAA